MNQINDWLYDSPEWIYLLGFIPLFLLLFWKLSLIRNQLRGNYRTCLILERSERNSWLKCSGFCLSWLFLTLSLMQPKVLDSMAVEWGKKQSALNETNQGTIKRKSHEVIFLLDTSASMTVADTRLGKSRLDYSKELIEEIVGRLKGETVSLYSFTSQVTPLVPPTLDYLYLRLFLKQVGINAGGIPGTNMEKLLAYLQEQELKIKSNQIKTAILLSDGEDPQLEELSAPERTQSIDSMMKHLQQSKKLNFSLIAVGIGSIEGGEIPNLAYHAKAVQSKLDSALLKQIAAAGNGTYFAANSYSQLGLASQIADEIEKKNYYVETEEQNSFEAPKQISENIPYLPVFQQPLAIAILLLMITGLIPETGVRK
jgi:Ca-activated chloride channel family protein